MKVGKRIFLLLLALLMAMPGGQAATVLEVGSSGENVRKVQQRLIQYDYLDGEADGKYGEATRDAVILFQRRNGLTVDGRVGPDTAAALGVTLSSSGSSSTSATIISADHRLLSKLVYAEARGESYKGRWPWRRSLKPRGERLLPQHHQRRHLPERGLFLRLQRLDQQHARLHGHPRGAGRPQRLDPTGGCLYYYNPRKTDDEWIRTRNGQNGDRQPLLAV